MWAGLAVPTSNGSPDDAVAAKIVVRLQDGTTYDHEVQDYPGLASYPFSWEDAVEKFEIKEAVHALEGILVKDLNGVAWSRAGLAIAARAITPSDTRPC
jgi:hypothetical protein